MARVEILTRAESRRLWTTEQKRQIVAESLGSDLIATEVARKHRSAHDLPGKPHSMEVIKLCVL